MKNTANFYRNGRKIGSYTRMPGQSDLEFESEVDRTEAFLYREENRGKSRPVDIIVTFTTENADEASQDNTF